MKIQYCSDLHLEFPDNKEYILNNPIETIADILILAGDIVPFKIMNEQKDFFDYISKNFKTTFWIPGNHEHYYYNVDSSSFLDTKIRNNIFLVNNCVKEISGVNLIFSTLWSNISESKRWIIQQSLSDFKVIKYFLNFILKPSFHHPNGFFLFSNKIAHHRICSFIIVIG